MSESDQLDSRCELLRSLHVAGNPLILPNAWDAATARAVEAAEFPVVATTSGGVAAALGYEDHQGAPAQEMLAAAGRIARAVDIPVTVDAEAGYGMEPAELVTALREIGAAGCNLEDSDYAAGTLRDPADHATWLGRVRAAAGDEGYELVINARIDLFLSALMSGSDAEQGRLAEEAVARASAYLEAGADCVFPILLREPEVIRSFASEVRGPVNVLALPDMPSTAGLAELGVARISYGTLLHGGLMNEFSQRLESLRVEE